MICGIKHFVLHIEGCGGAGVPALSYKKVNQTTKRAWNVRVVWRNRFFIFGLCFFREWFVSFKNRSLPCSRVQTGTRCGLVAAPNLHPPKISPKCSEKKSEWNDCDSKLFMSFHVKWLKMLKLVGMRHCWQMVEAWTWWKCQFLTNLWNVEITPKKTRSPIRRPSPIFHPQMRPKNCCKSLATSKFGKLLKMLKWVGMRNCWQMVEKWTWRKSWNWLTCEIVDKSLKCENDIRNVLSLQPRTKSWPGLLA